MQISAQIDMSGAIAKLRDLPQKIQDKAITQTINEVIARTQTEMKRQITGEYNIKAGDVAKSLRVSKANSKSAVIQATLSALAGSRNGVRNVILFGAKCVQGSGRVKYVRAKMKDGSWRMVKTREGQGVRVKIKKSGKSVFIEGAWIANNLAGTPVLFRDKNKNNQVRGFTTIDVPQMFNAKRINQQVIAFAKEQLIRSTERTLRRFNV